MLDGMKTDSTPGSEPGAASEKHSLISSITRRSFLQAVGLGSAAVALAPTARSQEKVIQGFEKAPTDPNASKGWKPVSDRKIRVGIVGYGVCQFGAAFGFQDHPNVEVVAVSDLIPDRCAELAKVGRCEKTYPSLEELVKDDRIEAVFVATDAPSHARHCIEVLKHGKHVASAVPAVFGSLEDAHKLFEAVKASGLKYMMFETSYFHEDLYAMRQIYKAGGLGKLVYSEGEYFHYMPTPIDSYKGWRVGLPPQWYPTHSNAYYVGVTGGQLHRSVLHGHAEPDRASAAGEQPLQESLRHGNRPVPHQRRRHGADGRSVGIRPATAARWAAFAGRRARTTASTKGWRRTCPTSSVRRCRPAWKPAATAARTATS